MEVIDDEFYVEHSPDNEESSRKKHQTSIKHTSKKQDRCHAWLPVLAISFL